MRISHVEFPNTPLLCQLFILLHTFSFLTTTVNSLRPAFLCFLTFPLIHLRVKVKVAQVVSDPLRPHERYSPYNSPGQNTGVGSCSLLQGIFPTQGSSPGLPLCRRILYQLRHKGSPSRHGAITPQSMYLTVIVCTYDTVPSTLSDLT